MLATPWYCAAEMRVARIFLLHKLLASVDSSMRRTLSMRIMHSGHAQQVGCALPLSRNSLAQQSDVLCTMKMPLSS